MEKDKQESEKKENESQEGLERETRIKANKQNVTSTNRDFVKLNV